MLQQIREGLKIMFSDLRFDEGRHLYYVNGENYPSVSKKLEDHYEKFDEEFFLPKCAAKEGVSEAELKARWREKNRIACEMGHNTHNFLEHFDPNKEYVIDIPQKRGGVKFLNDYVYCSNPRYFIIVQELRMIHRKYRFCGTTDMLLWDSWNNYIVVADWKTNEDLYRTYGYLKWPFDHFESNPFNKYQIQFNYYQAMIDQSPWKVGERWLIYLDAEGEYQVHKVLDLQRELHQYLDNPNVNMPVTYGFTW